MPPLRKEKQPNSATWAVMIGQMKKSVPNPNLSEGLTNKPSAELAPVGPASSVPTWDPDRDRHVA